MRRNEAVLTPSPPSFMAVQQDSSQLETDSLSPSIIVTVLVIAAAVIVSAAILLLLRWFRKRQGLAATVQIDATAYSLHQFHGGDLRSFTPQDASLIDSLPLFKFSSLTGTAAAAAAGDCAVCLSKFEPDDQLRLLSVCCHAFHADCIDAWIITNQTCPLCRSPIFVSESEVMNKILSTAPPNSSGRSGSESFRVEIGSISSRHLPSVDTGSGNHRRSYSIGSFDYIVDDVLSEVTVSSPRRRSNFATGAGDKSDRHHEADILAAEVAGGEQRGRSSSWLKDYVDRIARTASVSLSSSFRSSGRFFVGSSRRTEASRVNELGLEASRLGDEIGEMFGWLSGV